MLLELNIKDFAIIDTLHLRLHRLFNVFTGETGAGKSIIIDAMSTLLGGKIGAEVVRSGAERASVEGVFSIQALPPISDEWKPFEATLGADGNGTGTLQSGLTQVDSGNASTDHADVESADARVALAHFSGRPSVEVEVVLRRPVARIERGRRVLGGEVHRRVVEPMQVAAGKE